MDALVDSAALGGHLISHCLVHGKTAIVAHDDATALNWLSRVMHSGKRDSRRTRSFRLLAVEMPMPI
jgi:hypothetical protein